MGRDITPERLRGVLRSVRRSEDDQLTNPRIAAAAALLVVLLPLVPFLVVVWMVSRTLRGVRERVSWE